MGLKGWYPFIRQKGYDPVILHQSAPFNIITNGRRRLDVLGACYGVIRNAYSNKTQEVANLILEKEVSRFGPLSGTTLYIDGYQAAEKSETAVVRQKQREKAWERTATGLNTMEYRMENKLRLRKRHFADVRSGLSSSFYWSLESRENFAKHMASKGCIIRDVETEADVAIAIDAQPGDVIISADSDMLAYATVQTLWRPVSKGLILSYCVPDLLQTLGVSRSQLTALAIVSHNDYNKNILTLGPVTNFSIIKSISSKDPRTVVAKYLQDNRVVGKNKESRTFELSIRVFVGLQQTSLGKDNYPPTSQDMYKHLRERFQRLCTRYEESKHTEREGQKTSPSSDEVERIHVPRSVNQFRTVESPKQSSRDSRSSPLQPANTSQSPASLNQDLESEGHPPLARTRVPRHRLRFSFKERRGTVSHEPPTKAKQFVWKPPKEISKSAKDPSATSDKADQKNKKAPKTKKKLKEASPSAGPAIYADKNKKSLVFSLGRHHPISSLDVGKLDANTKRVFLDNPGVQQEVVECIKEASRLAVDVKREAQRLIGQFLEKLRTRIDAEVAKARGQKKNGESLSESERLKARWDALSHEEREILYYLAGNTKPKEEGDEEDIEENQDGVDDGDSEDDESKHTQFLRSFVVYVYSRNPPKKTTKVGGAVDAFINILAGMDLLNISHTRGELNRTMLFTPTHPVRSVTSQLAAELKKMYQDGSNLLHDKVKMPLLLTNTCFIQAIATFYNANTSEYTHTVVKFKEQQQVWEKNRGACYEQSYR